jgi:opacity protein-like surface antigen
MRKANSVIRLVLQAGPDFLRFFKKKVGALRKITKGVATMKSKLILMMATLAALCLSLAMPAAADDKNSNIGLKLNLGLGSQDVPQSQNLEKGDLASLSLGYGVSQRVTIWLGADVSKHAHELDPKLESDLVGIELGVQYKLRPHQKFRPYGKFGLGVFALGTEATDTVLSGGGVTWGPGAEYRLVRFLSVGAEFFWKDFDYAQQRVGKDNEFQKLERPILGNTKGFMLNFIIH